MENDLVTLDPASEENVDLLIKWTLDPVAQGPYKRVPAMTPEQLRELFLHAPDRRYFLMSRTADWKPLGRFYYRAYRFHPDPLKIDYDLNIIIADPTERGKGYGTAAQALASDFLLRQPETHSVFAFTYVTNTAEQSALRKAGFVEASLLPSPYYRVDPPGMPSMLFVRQ
ncbi:MAG: GNAT family N-acetyltransferase [Chloroflexi bacterium]|nr:GNAT family N-acetyltransferase [Chloroflexota bacterium]